MFAILTAEHLNTKRIEWIQNYQEEILQKVSKKPNRNVHSLEFTVGYRSRVVDVLL